MKYLGLHLTVKNHWSPQATSTQDHKRVGWSCHSSFYYAQFSFFQRFKKIPICPTKPEVRGYTSPKSFTTHLCNFAAKVLSLRLSLNLHSKISHLTANPRELTIGQKIVSNMNLPAAFKLIAEENPLFEHISVNWYQNRLAQSEIFLST